MPSSRRCRSAFYDAVRGLLGRLRPRQLDDMSLEQAVRALLRELELERHGIVTRLSGGWRTAISPTPSGSPCSGSVGRGSTTW